MKKIEIENFLKMNPQIPQFSQKNTNYLIAGANPISYLDDGSQEEQIAPLSASIDWKAISPSLVDSYGVSNQSVDFFIHAGSAIAVGETFLNANSIVLSVASVMLKKFGSPTGSVYAYIYAMSGTAGTNGVPTGSFLATSDPVDPAGLTTSYVLTNIVFTGANKITLSANTHYVLVIKYTGGGGSDYVLVRGGTTLADHNNVQSTNGTSWVADPSYNVIFYVYGGGVATTPIEGNIVHMIPSTDSTYSVYAITDTTRVYGITSASITDLGYPFTTSANDGTGCLAIGGGGSAGVGYLFASRANSGTIFKNTLPATLGGWSAVGGTSLQTTCGNHILEPFLDFIAVRDGGSSFVQGGVIRKLNVTTLAVESPVLLDIGAGFGIMRMRNLNNKYLVIAGGKTNSGSIQNSSYTQNYLFLWDGSSSRYQQAIKIPGRFIDMKVIDSVLYVAVQLSSGKTCVYYLFNTILRKVFTTQISTISTIVNSLLNCSLFDFKGYLGIHLITNTDLNNPLMVYGKDEMGDLEFIHSSGRLFDQKCVGYDGILYVSEFISGGSDKVYYLPTTLPTNGTYQQILYKSQWIPVKNLQAIDIYYDTPPQSAGDYIDVTLYGDGEDIIAGTSTTPLLPSGESHSITYLTKLNAKRTRLDILGFTGNQAIIKISTTNSTWRPIIRKISLIVK